MEYEAAHIQDLIDGLSPRNLALDLGCGEGRITFQLADHFDLVLGYDFSPGMISIANQLRIHKAAGNIRFQVRDLELELLKDIQTGTVDFVAATFGMGSFFRQPERLFREVNRVLRPDGRAVFSFYNKSALVNELALPDDWESSLAAVVSPTSEHGLVVTRGPGVSYDISARAYDVDEVRRLCEKHFNRNSILTYPSITAILPQSVAGHADAALICDRIDQVLAKEQNLPFGAYIMATATRGGGAALNADKRPVGYVRLLDVLDRSGVSCDRREHQPVQSMQDVFGIIDAPHECLLKAVLMRVRRPSQDNEPLKYVLCVVSAENRVHERVASASLGLKHGVHMADLEDVEQVTGFPVGALPPIGMPRTIPVVFDEAIVRDVGIDATVWCGAGRSTESLSMPLRDLIRVANGTILPLS
jgi:SAM-dependent methyltransferase/prolyl-tRNA editing enzyme YbaK/EbsC (Cys-tRNA(Pro) deacylase)